MSSSVAESEATGMFERRDVYMDEAFQVVTEGWISTPNDLQQALFPRLMTQDTGLLIPTGPRAGRFEAIVIPSLLGMRVDAAAHRLFIIGPDGSPLDDYIYRLSTYVRALTVSDGVERTVWYEEPMRAPIARRYQADGSFVNGAADHPFSEDVDIVVMPFSHFRSLFFSSGGVYGVPEVFGFDKDSASEMAPRGLFYFDEAYGASRDQRIEFVRLVEFLFAQDLDIVVGASSLTPSLEEELAFLEPLFLPEAQVQPERRLQYTEVLGEDETLARMEQAVRQSYFQNSRVIVALNCTANPNSLELGVLPSVEERLATLHARLVAAYPSNVYLYSTDSSRSVRTQVYAQLRELEKEGEGYLLLTDGPALEVSDLDATILITEPCDALSLVRRAGRCNRRGDNPGDDSLLHVIGDASLAHASDSGALGKAYLSALRAASDAPVPFKADAWKRLIG